LADFELRLQVEVAKLDHEIQMGREPNAAQLAEIIRICAWMHAEWVRIHPFANGNGRTARLWVNSIVLRYGLPPFLRLRPRPGGTDYARASAQVMLGHWELTAAVFLRLYIQYIDELDEA
jgi:hypothetical protein